MSLVKLAAITSERLYNAIEGRVRKYDPERAIAMRFDPYFKKELEETVNRHNKIIQTKKEIALPISDGKNIMDFKYNSYLKDSKRNELSTLLNDAASDRSYRRSHYGKRLLGSIKEEKNKIMGSFNTPEISIPISSTTVAQTVPTTVTNSRTPSINVKGRIGKALTLGLGVAGLGLGAGYLIRKHNKKNKE